MSCPEYRELLIEAARGGEAPPHVRDCAQCASFLARQTRLSCAMAELRAVAGSAALAACPPVAEPVRKSTWRYAVAAGALAASLAAAWLLYPAKPAHIQPAPLETANILMPKPPPAATVPARKHTAPRKLRKARPSPQPEEDFVAVPYTVPLAPGERAQILRVDVPLRDLIAAGAPISAPDPSRLARADVLVGEDGRARAFRVISVSDSSSNRSIYK